MRSKESMQDVAYKMHKKCNLWGFSFNTFCLPSWPQSKTAQWLEGSPSWDGSRPTMWATCRTLRCQTSSWPWQSTCRTTTRPTESSYIMSCYHVQNIQPNFACSVSFKSKIIRSSMFRIMLFQIYMLFRSTFVYNDHTVGTLQTLLILIINP